jgi:hypothetical protein
VNLYVFTSHELAGSDWLVVIVVSDLSDLWTVRHDQVDCIPEDGPLEVSITDFGGQV